MPQPGPTPVLILSNDGAATRRDYEPHTPGLSGHIAPFEFPHVPDHSPFVMTEVPQEVWLHLAMQRPELIKDYMMFPHEPRVMEAMVEAGIDGSSSYAVIGETAIKTLPLKVSYWPDSDTYLLHGVKLFGEHHQAAESMVAGAWFYSQLNGQADEVSRLMADDESMDAVLSGARILLIPRGAALFHPRPVGVSARHGESGTVKEFWVPKPGQRAMWGSPAELRVKDDIRERMGVGYIIKAIVDAAREAWMKGLKPAIVWDIDGTLLSTREFAAHIFNEWVDKIYDGPDAEEIRSLMAEKGITETWDSDSALSELGITREETLASAKEYFNSNFHSPVRRLSMPPILPMIELLKIFQSVGFIRTIFSTLRTRVNDDLPDGNSSAENSLRRHGAWDSRVVLLRREIDDIGSFMKACNDSRGEPLKWDESLKPFRKANPDVYIVAVVDNAPYQVGGYRRVFGDSVINVHVAGDMPPNSPPLPEGVFTVKPDQLMGDIEGWRAGYAARGAQHAQEFLLRYGAMLAGRSYYLLDDDVGRLERSIGRDAKSAADVLDLISVYGGWHPTAQAFMEAINGTFTGSPWRMEQFEDVLDGVNHYSGRTFGVIRGRDGVQRIARTDRTFPHDVELLPPPPDFRSDPIEVMPGYQGLYFLPETLAAIEAGEPLAKMDHAALYERLSFGRYPRMEYALGQIVGALAFGTERPVSEIVAVENSPRLALAAMICLARMGMKAGWREASDAMRYQTEFELMRVPEATRSRIMHVPQGGTKADLSIWNRPYEHVRLSEMAKGVRSGGFVLVQSEQRADRYFREETGHNLLFEMPLESGEYVLPTAFLGAGALSFQAWMVR